MNSNIENMVGQGRRSGVGKVLGNNHVRIKSRPVLGTISQNMIRVPSKSTANKDTIKPSFTIYNDKENIGVKNQSKAKKEEKIDMQLSNIHINERPAWQNEDPIEDLNDSFLNSSDASENYMDIESVWRVPPTEPCHEEETSTTPEYSQEIYQYLKSKEVDTLAKPRYMDKQPHITFNMRSILVDWLVEVADEYNLCAETLHLTFSYMDRFLSFMSVERSKLQLVGISCMFIAAKYEEIFPPNVGEFVYITDDSYTKTQILRMEKLILKVLNFDLSVPTSHLFVNHLCQMFQMEEQELHLAMYLLELSFIDGATFIKFSPSILAASSVALTRFTMGEDAWTDDMEKMAGYTCEHLRECIVALQGAFVNADNYTQQAIRNKYKSERFHSVSEITPRSIA